MMEMAVLGDSEFILGFQLVGITRVEEAMDNPTRQLTDLMDIGAVGIIIVDDVTLGKVGEQERYLAERSPKPIVISLSKSEGGQEDLRKMIKQAIGVDLLKED